MAQTSWTHLVRFVYDGHPTFAQVVDPKDNDELGDQIEVNLATGNPAKGNIVLTGKIVTAEKKSLLAPVSGVPIVALTGLNYEDHLLEAKMPDLRSPLPRIFYRPAASIAAPFPDALRVYKIQQECLDYEGELVFQTGTEPVKDLSVEEAEKHIIGFTVGIDFSPRPGKALGKMNYLFSKAFDNWTPVGPVLVNPDVLGTHPKVSLETRWNGRVVQQANTDSMIFNPAQILSSMSTGTTVLPGTVVWTGTCGGGIYFVKEGEKGGIQSGDQVDVKLSRIGTVSAIVKYDE